MGLIPTVRGIRRRADIRVNLEHLKHLTKTAVWLSSPDLPVRLVAIPEEALQGFNNEVLDLDHVQFAREGAIDIPGEETAELGRLARDYGVYIMAQAKARHPDWKDRFFNVGFIINFYMLAPNMGTYYLFAEKAEGGLAILVIDKYLDELVAIGDRHYLIERGQVAWTGTPRERAADPALGHRYLGG